MKYVSRKFQSQQPRDWPSPSAWPSPAPGGSRSQRWRRSEWRAPAPWPVSPSGLEEEDLLSYPLEMHHVDIEHGHVEWIYQLIIIFHRCVRLCEFIRGYLMLRKIYGHIRIRRDHVISITTDWEQQTGNLPAFLPRIKRCPAGFSSKQISSMEHL